MQSDVAFGTGPRRTHPATVALGAFWLAMGLLLALVGGGLFDLALQAFGVFTIAGWWFRTYEVKPDELIGATACCRHRRNGQARRVRREDRMRVADAVQLAPECVLRVEIFDNGFDHDVA